MQLQDVDTLEMPQTLVQTSAKRIIGVVHEGFVAVRIPVLAELGGDGQLITLLGFERVEELTEPLFGDAVGWSGIEISNPGQPGKLKQTDRIAFRGNVGRQMPPGLTEADDPQT